MKQTITKCIIGGLLSVGLANCTNDDAAFNAGEGKLLLTTKINSELKVASRAADDSQLAEECIIWLSNDKGRIYDWTGVSNIPTDGVKLVSGSYVVEAWAGKYADASWTDRWFTGKQEFEITSGSSTRVQLTCKIANTVVEVFYDDDVDDVLENYTLTVGHKKGSLDFEGKTSATGYFMLPEGETELQWKLTGTSKVNGSTYNHEGTISDVKGSYKYNIKVSCSEKESEDIGGLYFTIEVDPNFASEEETVTGIVLAPEIDGYNFDITKPQTSAQGNFTHRTLFVKSGVGLTSVVIESADFPEILGFGDGEHDIDLIKVTDQNYLSKMDGKITFNYLPNEDEEDGSSMMKIRFEEAYMNALKNGSHTITIRATDNEESPKTSTAVITINVTDALAEAPEVTLDDVRAYSATLRANILKDVDEAVFNYRKKGDPEWQTITAVADASARSRAFTNGEAVKAELYDLQPGTEYEWKLVCGEYETDVKTFSTGSAEQLPNNSFEDGHYSGSPWVLFAEGDEMFWDSGNHGSTTLGSSYNITTRVSSPVKEGNYSLSLASRKVVIKFAAGNVFAGKYLKTDGTDGVLGWGRPFTGRPKQVKFWAHYTPKNIDNTSSDAPEYKKGNPDVGTIYIALMDDNTESYSGERYPVVVKTKASERRLFDPYGRDKEHVIAYGVHDFTEATPGSDLVEYTIDLDYESFGKKDVIPTYIILTASASKGGDYFAGGAGSTLILDDIQLIYD